MLRNYSCPSDSQTNSQSSTFQNSSQQNSYPTDEYVENNYQRPYDNSQSSSNSFFNPINNMPKKAPVLDDITNLINIPDPTRYEFLANPDSLNSKIQPNNAIIRKFDWAKSGNMEVEDNDISSNVLNLDAPSSSTSTYGILDGLSHKLDIPKKTKTRAFAGLSNSQDYVKPTPKNPSLIKRWKKNDKVFQGKFSTGTTPKWAKNTMPMGTISLIPFKRCNTDVPPTFESDKLLMHGEKSEIGANKYINNLLEPTEGTKQRALSFESGNALLKQSLPKTLGLNLKLNNLTNIQGTKLPLTSKPKLLRDFPLDLTQNNTFIKQNQKPEPSLFLIPERNLEYDLAPTQQAPRKSAKKEKNDLVAKLLSFEEEENDEQNEEDENMSDLEDIQQEAEDEEMGTPLIRQSSPLIHGTMSPEPQKEFHTPPKNDSPSHEVKSGFFDTVTARKEPHSKLFPKGDEAVSAFDPFATKRRFEDSTPSEAEVFEHHNRSRFEQDYEVLEVLGSGNFGSVYKCQNRLDGLIYAVKCTRNKLKGQNNISQALNEAQALASLSALDDNPFIVRYYSAWIEDDRLYLAMEHCQNNLKALRRQHIRFSESMIRQIMRDICMGLRHLHNQKIVHLDIKPENILYSKTKKYKIADLGLSRIAQRSNHEDINEGDCRYLAPELLKDYADFEIPDLTKADIFSFGATIYELMIGTDLPKNGSEWSSLRDGNLVKLDQLNYSNSLKSMLRSMMSSNPDYRPSAHELLTNYLQSEIELELKWEKRQNKILKERVKELEEMLHARRKNSF